MLKKYFFNVVLVNILISVSVKGQIRSPSIDLSLEKNKDYPPCKSCSVLVDSFKNGLKKTKRGKHEGGDALWEEEKLGSYKTSELRLVEIQENLCRDIQRGQNQCHNLANEHEELIESWWFKRKEDENSDLFSWLCIDQLKVCCPDNHFGPTCSECTNCNGNGKCKGNGTRKGNGKCTCDTGYSGEFCNECDLEFYESYRDETKLLCSACHSACGTGGCTGGGPKDCRKCKTGWIMNSEAGCFDINECLDSKNPCTSQQFCVNNEGSYSCLDCDRSCNGCNGDGPDLCIKCAENYEIRDGKCTDLTAEKRDQWVVFTRFLTYLGLCIATCAIFKSSTYLAAIVGTAVAVYIASSEYWLNSSPSSGSPIFDTKQLEELISNSL